jgi:hypothetical protein
VPERTTHRSVTFLHPFSISGVVGEQPAGTCTIETTEEPIDTLSFIAYRRVSTTMVLPASGRATPSRQAVTIDPRDLEAARKRDAQITRQARDCGSHRHFSHLSGLPTRKANRAKLVGTGLGNGIK